MEHNGNEASNGREDQNICLFLRIRFGGFFLSFFFSLLSSCCSQNKNKSVFIHQAVPCGRTSAAARYWSERLNRLCLFMHVIIVEVRWEAPDMPLVRAMCT